MRQKLKHTYRKQEGQQQTDQTVHQRATEEEKIKFDICNEF